MAAAKKKTAGNARDLLDQIQAIGSSIVYLAKDGSDRVIEELEEAGILDENEGKQTAKELKGDFKKRKNKLYDRVIHHVRKVVDDVGIETKKKNAK